MTATIQLIGKLLTVSDRKQVTGNKEIIGNMFSACVGSRCPAKCIE